MSTTNLVFAILFLLSVWSIAGSLVNIHKAIKRIADEREKRR